MKRQDGGISIFLVIIFLSLFIFAALMVDLARIIVAERKVENAVQTAARSILADYDPNLVGQFGLYGVNLEGKKFNAQKYLRLNLRERHEGFIFINYQIEDVNIHSLPTELLLNDELFERQILEYMKYKIPLIVGERVLNKFKQVDLDKVAAAGKEGVKTSQRSKAMRGKIIDINRLIPDINTNLSSSGLYALKGELLDLQEKIKSYKEQLDKSNESLQELELVIHGTNQKIKDEDVIKIEYRVKMLLEDVEHNLTLQRQIEILQAELNPDVGYMDDSAIQYNQELVRMIQELTAQLRPLYSLDLPRVKQDRIKDKDKAAKDDLINEIWKLAKAELADPQIAPYLIKAEEFALANQSGGDAGEIAIQYSDYAKELEGMDEENQQAETSALGLFKIVESIGTALKSAAVSSGEKLAITEYIMDKFTFATSQTKRGHYFAIGEVEYILCGNNHQLVNLAEIFAKIFAIRFSLNVLNDFIKSPVPEPIARLCGALASGFGKGLKDMQLLYEGKEIDLYPGIVMPKVTYSDYLRLFLLLQSKKSHLDHMRQLMQVDLRMADMQFNLKNQSAAFTLEAEVSIDLLFIKGLDKLYPERFSKGRFLITKRATVGY